MTLQSVEDGRYGETLSVIWEVEPGRRMLPTGSLPEIARGGFDPRERLAAFLDAVRWSAVTSADVETLQAPFRSGVAIEDFQLDPVARAVDAPRVNLLLADDVGLVPGLTEPVSISSVTVSCTSWKEPTRTTDLDHRLSQL